MNAEFFALAFVAALNPKLLAVDLLLIENRRPRAMFLSVLLGGLTVGITVGLLDVLVFHVDHLKAQGTVSAGVDLALGLVLVAAGALVATGRLHGRRKTPVPAGNGQPEEKEKKDNWAQRVLAEPRLGLAMLVGALCGIPGGAYLKALRILVTSKSSTANQVIGVILFVLIEFLLIIIPFAFLELRPKATKAALKHAQDWLAGHARQLMAYTSLVLGTSLAIRSLVLLTKPLPL